MFLIAIVFPWYYEYNKLQQQTTSVQFFYLITRAPCDSGLCFQNSEYEFWDFDSSTKMERFVFGISLFFVILALGVAIKVATFISTFGSYMSALFSLISFLTFFCITPAIRYEALQCTEGPCNNFGGSTDNRAWGPSVGFYACAAGFLFMLVASIVDFTLNTEDDELLDDDLLPTKISLSSSPSINSKSEQKLAVDEQTRLLFLDASRGGIKPPTGIKGQNAVL
eukprot:CAMPEP_0206199470 /NCGR_PEP_ID=MMETSP0166-20121206/10285_1 /ASSEMBLY_ACC=CAM_ASM_000260 /TAXON_ID=95228 /ORGANISM="Vannella robusta, Strain DIVA3 518/3/11/1/6" /LENGTH=223 /DNA_ID=CAMNT_0053617587 /DNA_START=1 /DNA_END=672 /DNA_ORIENTATION=-